MTLYLLFLSLGLSIGLLIYHKKYMQTKSNILYLKSKIEELNRTDSFQRIKIMTDDQELRQLLLELNQLLESHYNNQRGYSQLEQSMKQMVSNISHDLKTPLTVILGYLETELLKSDIEIETKKNLEIIHKKSIELLTLINQFFDLSKLDSGDISVEMTSVEITEFIRSTIASLYKIIQDSKVDVDIHLPEQKIYVKTNRDMLKRVLDNLISNALKYGSDGKYLGIDVRTHNEYVEIKIIDKGKGIEKKYQNRVFDRLFTLEDSRNKAYQGSGLGLSITKKLVQNLGGEIELDSIPYRKTVFLIRLRM